MNKKAVVIDDDAKIIILAEKALSQLGFTVYSAGDGTQGLELIKKHEPDLVLSDILQPGIDGIQLCNTIKTYWPDTVKVILITGVYNEANFKLDMDCRADGFIEKPVDMACLAELVKEKVLGATGSETG